MLTRSNPDEGKPVMDHKNLFAKIDVDLYHSVEQVAQLAGLSKRAVVEDAIARLASITTPDRAVIGRAWSQWRRGERP